MRLIAMDVGRSRGKTAWRVENLFPHIDDFIWSTRLVTARDTNRTWVRVWPGIAFCAIHAERKLLPGDSSIRRPMSPAQAWAAFLEANDGNNELLEPLKRLRPLSGPTLPTDIFGDDYLLDDPEAVMYRTHGDGFARAEAAVLGYLDTVLQELNQRIVMALASKAGGTRLKNSCANWRWALPTRRRAIMIAWFRPFPHSGK